MTTCGHDCMFLTGLMNCYYCRSQLLLAVSVNTVCLYDTPLFTTGDYYNCLLRLLSMTVYRGRTQVMVVSNDFMFSFRLTDCACG